MQIKASIKHLQINKANNLIFVAVALASIVTVFSLMSAKALLSQSGYQRKVLKARNDSVKQLQDNIKAANSLKQQYEIFAKDNPNILGGQGGSNPGTGPKDGDNSRIVLDALPSQYDFPALMSSLEKIMTNRNLKIQGLGGTDAGDTLTADSGSTIVAAPGGTTQPVQMPFSISVQTNYLSTLDLIKDLEHSIRPIDVTTISLNGSTDTMTMSLQGATYYQPSVSLQITQKEVTK